MMLNSCGSNSSDSNKNPTSSDDNKNFSTQEKHFIHNLFLTEYLWYDQVASNIDYTQYSESTEMVKSLRVQPYDRWSYTITKQGYENFVNQKTAGFGFGYTPDLQIYLVRINAPAYGNLKRGDKIIQINDETASKELISQASNNHGVSSKFSILRNNNLIDINITPRRYNYNVSLGKVLSNKVTNVGYLRLDSFTGTSVAEFEQVFTEFKNARIDDLVIDLRYNSGGSIAAASSLLDNINNTHPAQRQVYLDWNPNQKNKNTEYSFEDKNEQDGNELNMKRVLFLVTKNSASASELVISALKPYLGDSNVITIGTSTHGKNTGMLGRAYNNNYYFLVNFFIKNNSDHKISFEGIPPTCHALDDISREMGDPKENMLAIALYYIVNNQCP